MPDPDEWYKKLKAREFIISFFNEDGKEIKIRQRWITEKKSNSKKKEVRTFSVGVELEGEIDPIVRHCNYNTDELEVFHTHHIGSKKKILRRLTTIKTPGAQMRWALKDIRDNFEKYIEKYKFSKENKV